MLLKVNPTRIELIRLKRKLKVVTQGYKLLKKKRDGLMREFLKVVKELKVQREKIKK
ncbi:MAG TPA: V-type ATP synthase subunit D, partial [bacterium]|nr:V-type ATP synthase subunit D [bacterium]HEX68056.1 V-type ATP synthase subunit D [bacterium]